MSKRGFGWYFLNDFKVKCCHDGCEYCNTKTLENHVKMRVHFSHTLEAQCQAEDPQHPALGQSP